eukprot:498365_1
MAQTNSDWACNSCTFVNSNTVTRCEMCYQSRGTQNKQNTANSINNEMTEEESIKLAVILSNHTDIGQMEQLNHLSSNFAKLKIQQNQSNNQLETQMKEVNKYEECKQNTETCDHLDRICYILNNYQIYISNKCNNHNYNNEQNENIFSIVYDNTNFVDHYDNTNLLNDFNHLMQSHPNDFENIYNILLQKIKLKHCDLRKCLLIRRNQRDKIKTMEKKRTQ